ncbi:MAG: ABC transporter permease [Pyrinomonadaceae bacterium]
MLRLILSRLLQALLALLLISTLTFSLLAAVGGDALTALRVDPLISEESIRRLSRVYNLDQPLHLRYARWVSGLLLRGDLGQSFFYQSSVWSVLKPRLSSTLLLASAALMMAVACSALLGAASARRPNSLIDRFCGLVILLTASTPRIVLALAALALIASMPAAADRAFQTTPGSFSWRGASGDVWQLCLAAFVLSVPLVAIFLGQTRDALKAALALDFVRVARAKGLSERAVLFRHALRAALNPLITTFGYSLGSLMSGSVVVETILNWPGLGQLSVTAVRNRDVPLLMGVVMLTSAAVLLGNLLADVLQHLSDPRLRRAADSARKSSPA